MEPSPSSRQGYSEFFTSGLRAVTRRTKIPSKSVNQGGYDRSSFWSEGHFEVQSNNLFARRRRHNSLIVDHKKGTDDKTKKSRSALMNIPARLFSLMSFMSATRSISSIGHQNQESFRGSSNDMGQSTSGGPFSDSSAPEESPILLPIDPFSSWSDSDSFVTDSLSGASTLNSVRRVEAKRESFLSLNSSSSNRSSVVLPRQERYTFLSISVSPQSSIHYRSSYQEKINVERDPEAEEEGEGEGGITIQRQAVVDSEAWDAPAWVDWRQFHNDLLQNDSVISMNY